jgi:hypothetical protein
MSSTYSTDLRLELIGTGDQAGVWGNTTNTTLGSLMEAAIAGYTSVSIIASPQALTALDGAADQARYNSIALTTTTGANFIVCVPPTPKLYTFYNASAYTATITNATAKNGITPTGGTTITIPAGKTMSMWTDGTNFTQQSTHFISPTIATPTITSPTMSTPTITGVSVAPTATYGTNTTQLATTAFVQAALQALYPIGSIYSSTVSTNPGTLFGFGTWVAYAAGRVLLGTDGSTYTPGATGGSADATLVSHTHTFSATSGAMSANASHTHTATDAGHTHGIYGASGQRDPANSNNYVRTNNASIAQSEVGYASITNSTTNTDHTHSVSGTTASSGSSATGANLQPYVVVYMWNRTA